MRTDEVNFLHDEGGTKLQALAMVFTEAFKQEHPDAYVVGLPESPNAINRAGFSEIYKQTYHD